MLQYKSVIFTIALVALTVSGVHAETYTIDTSHSQALFRVRHLGISRITGRFPGVTGTIQFDGKQLSDLRAEAEIDINSLNTDVEKRDRHLKSEEFFDAARYPKMTFKSRAVREVSGQQFRLAGDLTLHGVTREVVLDAEHGGSIKDPWGNFRTAFTATTKISRRDFGINWGTGGDVVGEEITIHIEIEATHR
ncbi:polyisoprenoid-binding protein [Desulfonema ishimotonii]|uniref:Polyisoprenoid-binding protein n=1 Tax=Desulfonema ishimotonii TaxID=45657 RepID=A0A401G3T8_9BACT|nr:YceI family protein [Desulfonema ishimotonii]GBC63908.1 polyisoprenoid-binding protein [Desulfonema ishimotonii]